MTDHIRIEEGYRYICRIGTCYKFFTTKQSFLNHRSVLHTSTSLLPNPFPIFSQLTTFVIFAICHEILRSLMSTKENTIIISLPSAKDAISIEFSFVGKTGPFVCVVCQRGFGRHSHIHTDENKLQMRS